MFRIAIIVLVAAAAFIGYSRLTAEAPHDQAIANLKTILRHSQTTYSQIRCDQDPSPANQFATDNFGGGVKLFDCDVVADGTVEPYCVIVGGNLPSNATGGESDVRCARFGSMPSRPGVGPGTN